MIDITDPVDKASTSPKTFETLSKYKMWHLKTIKLSVAIRALGMMLKDANKYVT